GCAKPRAVARNRSPGTCAARARRARRSSPEPTGPAGAPQRPAAVGSPPDLSGRPRPHRGRNAASAWLVVRHPGRTGPPLEPGPTLRLHGWWFDIQAAQVHNWNPDLGRFVPIDEGEAERLMRQLEPVSPPAAAPSDATTE